MPFFVQVEIASDDVVGGPTERPSQPAAPVGCEWRACTQAEFDQIQNFTPPLGNPGRIYYTGTGSGIDPEELLAYVWSFPLGGPLAQVPDPRVNIGLVVGGDVVRGANSGRLRIVGRVGGPVRVVEVEFLLNNMTTRRTNLSGPRVVSFNTGHELRIVFTNGLGSFTVPTTEPMLTQVLSSTSHNLREGFFIRVHSTAEWYRLGE